MKTTLIPSAIFLGIIFFFSGCYTQVATTSDSDQYQSSSSDENDSSYANPDNIAYNDYHDSDDWQHAHVGYSYYYPSNSTYWPSDYYASAYASPWSFSFGFGYGSYYPSYGYGSYYPYYGYGSCYPYYGYGTYYPYSYGQSVRTYGSTRTGAPVRGSAYGRSENVPSNVGGTSSDIYGRIPTGSVVQGGASQQLKRTNNGNVDARNQGSSRVGRSTQSQDSRIAPRRYQDGRTSGSRGSMGRAGTAPNSQQRNQQQGYQPSARSSEPSRGSQTRSAPQQQDSRSIAPPRYNAPAPAPSGGGSHSAPAPSRGGSGRRP